MSDRFRNALKGAWDKIERQQWIYGMVGKPTGGGNYDYEVPGRKNYIYVSVRNAEGAQTVTPARNDAAVPHVGGTGIRMRLEGTTYVIEGMAGRRDVGIVLPPSTSSGVPPHTHPPDAVSFLELTDTPAAYTGESGKILKVKVTEDGLELVEEAGGLDPGDTGGVGTELEWLFVGDGQMVDYGNDYVGWVDPANPAGGWGAVVVKATNQYFSAITVLQEVSGFGLTNMVTIDPGSVALKGLDNGQFSPGCTLTLGRNNNSTYPSAAAIHMDMASSGARYIWIDNSNQLRITTDLQAPASGNDTIGVVVGAQVSSLDTKVLVGKPLPYDEVAGFIRDAAKNGVRRFTYKQVSRKKFATKPFNGEEFSGIVTDFAPRYGMDKDKEHPNGKSLNTVNAIGDLMLVVAGLTEKVEKLEQQIKELKNDN